MQQMPAHLQHKTEAIATLNGDVTLFRLLISAGAARRVPHVSYIGSSNQPQSCDAENFLEESQCRFIITHQRDPLPFLAVCFNSTAMLRNGQLRSEGKSRTFAVHLLISAGFWEAAHRFASSLTDRDDGCGSCWDALGLAYLTKTHDYDRWPASGGPGPLWETVIDCARRSHIRWFGTRQGTEWKRLWQRVFVFSFAKKGSEAAIDVAEEAAGWILGKGELVLVAVEHRRAGREVKARRCERTAQNSCI